MHTSDGGLLLCPNCDSEEISSQSQCDWTWNEAGIHLYAWCQDCRLKWIESYIFQTWDIVEEAD